MLTVNLIRHGNPVFSAESFFTKDGNLINDDRTAGNSSQAADITATSEVSLRVCFALDRAAI